MPSPNEPLRAPYPNLVIPGWPRVAVHIISVTGTNGVAVLLGSKSSGGCTVTYVSEGLYTLTFPAGGTGAVGFTVVAAPEISDATADTQGVISSVDSDTVNYATGTLQVAFHDTSATQVPGDVIGTFTVMVFVLLGPGGAI